MTEDYIFSSMTWAEVSDALEFVDRWEEPKVQRYKKYKSISSWIRGARDSDFVNGVIEMRNLWRNTKKTNGN